MTAPSLMQTTMTSSTPFVLSAACAFRYPGTCGCVERAAQSEKNHERKNEPDLNVNNSRRRRPRVTRGYVGLITWHVDQVGVNAPGSPTTMTFFPAMRLEISTPSGG